jgi:putative MFS transporter
MLWSNNVAYILEGSREDFGLSGIEVGLLGACFPFGLMVGAFVWGVTGDRYGRMYAFKTTVVIATIFSLILTVSVHPAMSAICLFFLGAGMGGELSLGGTVFCEFCPPSKLYYLTRMATFWGAGGTLSALVALIVVLTNNTGISSWRFIVGSAFVVELLCMIFRFSLEETPAFCQESGQVNRMENILNNVSKENTSNELVFDTRMKSTLKDSVTSIEQVRDTDSWTLIKRLFASGNLKKVLIFGLVTLT